MSKNATALRGRAQTVLASLRRAEAQATDDGWESVQVRPATVREAILVLEECARVVRDLQDLVDGVGLFPAQVTAPVGTEEPS